MNFCYIPRLEYMAAARIALCIYYNNDIERLIERFEIFCNAHLIQDAKNLWKLIEDEAVEKLPSLLNVLKTRVSKFLKPIHFETKRWLKEHRFLKLLLGPWNSETFLKYKNNTCWRNDGTIDRTQTAKKFVQNERFDPQKRFVMACTYFLEDEILALWDGYRARITGDLSPFRTNAAVRFWKIRLERDFLWRIPWQTKIDGYIKELPTLLSAKHLRISCFFSFLTLEGKKKIFPYLRSLDGYSDDLFLCLQAMKEAERVEMVCANPAEVLLRLLTWPRQSLFVDVANKLWDYLDDSQFEKCLSIILRGFISPGLDDFDYTGLLKEFWYASPAQYKIKIKNEMIFKMIEVILNATLSLPETVQE